MNVTICRAEFDKLVNVVLGLPCDQAHGHEDWRGSFLLTWSDADQVETIQIVGTMIVICPD